MIQQQWLYRVSDGRLMTGGFVNVSRPVINDGSPEPAPDLAFDILTLVDDRLLDPRLHVVENGCVRDATAAEITAYDLARPKFLNTRDLIRRMTTAERAFLFRAATTNDTAAAWLLMLITDGTTDVHSVEWSGGVAFFVQAGVSAGVWPDTATANARVAEITA